VPGYSNCNTVKQPYMPSKLVQALKLLTWIWKVAGSYLGWNDGWVG